MKTQRVLQIINMSKLYNCRPSDILRIEEDYAAFCFDEACMFISVKLENGESPMFKRKYNSFSDIYKGLERRGTKCL